MRSIPQQGHNRADRGHDDSSLPMLECQAVIIGSLAISLFRKATFDHFWPGAHRRLRSVCLACETFWNELWDCR